MTITETDRARFRAFMQPTWQNGKVSKVKDATIYLLETTWLPSPVFYVGVSQRPAERLQEHRTDWPNNEEREAFLWEIADPLEFDEALAVPWEFNLRYENGLWRGGTFLKQHVTLASQTQGCEITMTPLETLAAADYNIPAWKFLSTPAREIMKPRLWLAAQERERRWIFHKLKEGAKLVNPEGLCRTMIQALRAHPEIDVLQTPLTSPAWDAIIPAYLQDAPVLRDYHLS